MLIPECMGVASHYDAPNPLDYCTCKKELSPAQYERQKYNEHVQELQHEIKLLREENEFLRRHSIKLEEYERSNAGSDRSRGAAGHGRDKLDKMSREWAHEEKQWIMQGWGYKPKLNPAAKTAFRSPLYWFRIRSFCARSPYG